MNAARASGPLCARLPVPCFLVYLFPCLLVYLFPCLLVYLFPCLLLWRLRNEPALHHPLGQVARAADHVADFTVELVGVEGEAGQALLLHHHAHALRASRMRKHFGWLMSSRVTPPKLGCRSSTVSMKRDQGVSLCLVTHSIPHFCPPEYDLEQESETILG